MEQLVNPTNHVTLALLVSVRVEWILLVVNIVTNLEIQQIMIKV